MFTIRLAVSLICLTGCFLAGQRTNYKDDSDRKFHGKWEVIAEVQGERVEFPMYDSIVLTENALILQENGVDAVLGYRKADDVDPKDELKILAWNIDGSADGTPAGTPTFAFAMKVKGNRGIARLSGGDMPSDVYKARKDDEMHSMLFVLKRIEEKNQDN